MALTVFPRVSALAGCLVFLSSYFCLLFGVMNIGGLLVLAVAPWCTTSASAKAVSLTSFLLQTHCLAALLLAEGPPLVGIAIMIFVTLPLFARLMGKYVSKRTQSILIAYLWLGMHAIYALRFNDVTVPSPLVLVDHGLTAGIRNIFNLVTLNVVVVVLWHISKTVVDDESKQAQDRLFATISHDMRQPY
jgi:hypothetical protein